MEILTGKHPKPSRDWLNPRLGYINGARARAKVRQWYKRESRDDNIGPEKRRLSLKPGGSASYCQISSAVLERFNVNSVDDLYVAVGNGDLTTGQIFNALERMKAEQWCPRLKIC